VRSTPVVHDQAFPDRPVRIIDPFGAGGGVDVIARALASRLAAAWGQPAIVENHPGAGSTAAPALVAQAPPDGYTLLINTSAQAYSAARAGELPYDPLRDFVPVAALTSQPYVLVAGPPSGITTIGELAAAASAHMPLSGRSPRELGHILGAWFSNVGSGREGSRAVLVGHFRVSSGRPLTCQLCGISPVPVWRAGRGDWPGRSRGLVRAG
jgi:tripartite-type tricarboxylate transporter receptor subunit TctC